MSGCGAFAAVAAAVAAPVAPASAQFTTYDSQAQFLAALNPGAYSENFAALAAGDLTGPATFSGGSFSLVASTITSNVNKDLYVLEDSGGKALVTLDSGAQLVFDFSASPTPVKAFGGQFFATDFAGAPSAGNVTISALTASGQTVQRTLTYNTAPASYGSAQFFGVSTSGPSPVTQVTVTIENSAFYATSANLITGAVPVVAIPEPGAVSLWGGAAPLGLAALASGRVARRRQRRRLPVG